LDGKLCGRLCGGLCGLSDWRLGGGLSVTYDDVGLSMTIAGSEGSSKSIRERFDLIARSKSGNMFSLKLKVKSSKVISALLSIW
jgi:hypothetical protein